MTLPSVDTLRQDLRCLPEGRGCLDARCERCWVDAGPPATPLPESALDTERPPPRSRVLFESIEWTISGSV